VKAIIFVTLRMIFIAQAIISVREASFSVNEKIISVTDTVAIDSQKSLSERHSKRRGVRKSVTQCQLDREAAGWARVVVLKDLHASLVFIYALRCKFQRAKMTMCQPSPEEK